MRILIVVQLFVVVILTIYIGYVSLSPKTQISIAPIDQSATIQYTTENLEYFFEFTPGVKDAQVKPTWLADYKLINTINSDTLNERYEYATTTPPGTYRIVTLGDSWTYGQFVSTHDNFSEKLEDMLNERLSCRTIQNFEVINLGMPNYDIAYATERFNIRGKKYNPDVVLWLLIPNDFTEITEVFRDLYNKKYTEITEVPIDQLYDEEYGYKGMRVSSGNIREAMAAIAALEEIKALYTNTEILDYQFSAFDTFQTHFSGPTVFYYIPKYLGYSPDIVSRLTSYAGAHHHIDILQSEFSWKKDFSLPDQHPSPKGHAQIAEEYLDYLLTNQLTNCTVQN